MSTTMTRREWRQDRARQQRTIRIGYGIVIATALMCVVVFVFALSQA
ncbi:tetrahydromethanopterin S-methyltransferase subunit G [Arthrobacter sp. UYP6]